MSSQFLAIMITMYLARRIQLYGEKRSLSGIINSAELRLAHNNNFSKMKLKV
jgi:hypothetical protein